MVQLNAGLWFLVSNFATAKSSTSTVNYAYGVYDNVNHNHVLITGACFTNMG